MEEYSVIFSFIKLDFFYIMFYIGVYKTLCSVYYSTGRTLFHPYCSIYSMISLNFNGLRKWVFSMPTADENPFQTKMLEWVGILLIVMPAVILASSPASPPMMLLYPMWITGSVLAGIGAVFRRSSANLFLNLAMLVINLIGLSNYL